MVTFNENLFLEIRKQVEKEEVRRFIEAQEAFEKLEREKTQRENERIEAFIERKAEWVREVEVAAKERRWAELQVAQVF